MANKTNNVKPSRSRYKQRTPYKLRKIKNIVRCNKVRVDPKQPRKDAQGKRIAVPTRSLSISEATNLWNSVRKREPGK